MSETKPRPGHTTLAGALVVGGSVGVVVAVAEQLSGLYSLETRQQVADFLATPPGSDLGVSVPAALDVLRVVLMVLAGCATAAAVLGWHALRGSRGARTGLTVLVVPIFVGGLAVGGVLTALVAAGTALLWTGPSAYWFRGEPVPDLGARGPGGRPSPPPLPPLGPGAPPAQDGPRPTLTTERPSAPPVGPPPPVVRRPDALVWACVLTWSFTALAAAVMGGSALLMVTQPDLVLAEVERQGSEVAGQDADAIGRTVYVSAAAVVLWSLLAAVLAVLAYRGSGWARSALLASAAVAAVVSLLGVVYSVVMVLPAGAALTTVVLLSRSEVRAWCAGRPGDASVPRGPMQS